MKKLLGILLILCLTVPLAVSMLWLQYEKGQVRKEVKRRIIAGMDREELVSLKFSTKKASKALRWEHSKEFEYKGQMYDVVESEKKNDTLYFWCWSDHEETALNRQLNYLIAEALGNDPENQKSQNRLQDFFKSLYHSRTMTEGVFLPFKDNTLACHYTHLYTSPGFSPPVPPPKQG